jgi:hypothetical protein
LFGSGFESPKFLTINFVKAYFFIFIFNLNYTTKKNSKTSEKVIELHDSISGIPANESFEFSKVQNHTNSKGMYQITESHPQESITQFTDVVLETGFFIVSGMGFERKKYLKRCKENNKAFCGIRTQARVIYSSFASVFPQTSQQSQY